MKILIQAVAIGSALAGPALAQDAGQEPGARLDAMTCREFIAYIPEDQIKVMLALRAHLNGDPLPDAPLPVAAAGTDGGETGTASGAGGTAVAGDAGVAGSDAGTAGTDAGTAGTDGGSAGTDAGTAGSDAGMAGADATAAATEAPAGGDAAAAEVTDTVAAQAGEPSPEALAGESLTEQPGDPKLTAMRTSCLGAPDALASDAMRAAHADYE